MDLTSPENLNVDVSEAKTATEAVTSMSTNSMEEFYALRDELLMVTLVVSGIAFCGIWLFYSLNTAGSYLMGSLVGMVYLGMLARNVERLNYQSKISKNRLALFAVLIILACRLDQIQVLPVFLGFLTFKTAIIFYTLRITLRR